MTWIDTGDTEIGVEGALPSCHVCHRYLFAPMVIEAIYSVSIDSVKSAPEIAKEFIEYYHNHLHSGM